MFISDELNIQQKIEFRRFFLNIIKRMKVIELDPTSVRTDYRGEIFSVACDNYRIEEYFQNEMILEKSGRRPLSEGYEKNNVAKLKDGTICVKSLLSIPSYDKRFEKKEKNTDPRFVSAFMLYPTVRKYAPNILSECLNEDIQEYQLNDAFGFLLASYKAMNMLNREFESIKEEWREQNNF
ncbi:MAG: hypothetical protein EOM55_00970 [Clostridia bacterium]|nr:hypothetical protein [Clostridia bacterium]